MKKVSNFIIVFMFLCVLTGAVLFLDPPNEVIQHAISDQEEQHSQEDIAQEELVQEENVGENVIQEHSVEPDVTPQNTEKQTPVLSEESTTSEQPSTSEQPTTSSPTNDVLEIPTEKINVGTVNDAEHTPISESSYYQYGYLNDSEKVIYKVIVQAIKDSETLVNLQDYSCSKDMISKIYECIMADYPQYFYLAKNCSYICNLEEQYVKQLILMYTDGTTTDQYNEQGERIVTANRSVISQQVANLNAKVSEVLATISPNSSVLEKEKSIYDYIQSHLVYDKQAATMINSPEGTQIPHAFDVYGALCESRAVCEGYAKLFQYLCYCVGIQSTQVFGTSSGQPHMWNAVKIGNEWYMADATWDDYEDESLHLYNYFNVTTTQISVDHAIDTSILQVPHCNSETYAFYKQYALYISDLSMPPINYQQVIDDFAKNGGKHLCVYLGNQNGAMKDYFVTQILNSDSAVQQYISSMNYAIVLDNQYILAGNYGYIPLK